NTPNIVGSGPNWLFDIDALTKSMNYKPVVAGNQSNGNACTKAYDDACKARMKIVHGKDYILLPLWTTDPPFSQSSKSSSNAGLNLQEMMKRRLLKIQEKIVNVMIKRRKIMLTSLTLLIIFEDDEDVGAEANMNNLDTTIQVSPIPTIRTHKDHPLDQVIGDFHLATQTRNMLKNLEEY
ncbi:hypothetical protein Tco_0225262, partial [Tanacetum coccineum]